MIDMMDNRNVWWRGKVCEGRMEDYEAAFNQYLPIRNAISFNLNRSIDCYRANPNYNTANMVDNYTMLMSYSRPSEADVKQWC